MNPLRDRRRLRNECKRIALAWSLLCAAGATLGGIIGLITWEADPDR